MPLYQLPQNPWIKMTAQSAANDVVGMASPIGMALRVGPWQGMQRAVDDVFTPAEKFSMDKINMLRLQQKAAQGVAAADSAKQMLTNQLIGKQAAIGQADEEIGLLRWLLEKQQRAFERGR